MTATIPAGFAALPLPIVQLSLAAVLKCGQSFRWNIFPLLDTPLPQEVSPVPTHEYRLCLRDRVVCLRQNPDSLFYRAYFPSPSQTAEEEASRKAETLAWLKDYFQLDVDLIKLYAEWSQRDPVFAGVKSRFAGIRMLRQDPWENLISFICSSNNHISRITGMVKSLCKQFSPPLISLPPPLLAENPGRCLPTPGPEGDLSCTPTPAHETEAYHPFPSPSTLAAPGVSAVLRTLGCGYRAEYIQRTAALLVQEHGGTIPPGELVESGEKWLHTLRQRDIGEAREELLKFMGVGRKVADCVLLMSMDKKECIPVDTHVHQIAIKHYGLRSSSGSKAKAAMTPKLYDEVNAKLTAVWGEYAGWAHSVLFTADLKAFSSYGLPTPVLTPTNEARQPMLPSPSPSPSKRKRNTHKSSADISPVMPASVLIDGTASAEAVGLEDGQEASLADRVKRRRRAAKP